MDLIYSTSLIVALLAGALALGTLSLVTSVLVNQLWGHGPATVQPLGFGRVIAEHEVFVVVAVVLALGFAMTTYAERKRRARGTA